MVCVNRYNRDVIVVLTLGEMVIVDNDLIWRACNRKKSFFPKQTLIVVLLLGELATGYNDLKWRASAEKSYLSQPSPPPKVPTSPPSSPLLMTLVTHPVIIYLRLALKVQTHRYSPPHAQSHVLMYILHTGIIIQ